MNEIIKRKKNRKLSLKERKYIREFIKTGNQAESAMRAYDTHNRETAKSIGHQVISRPIVKEYLQQILNKAGLTMENLTDQLHSSMNYNLEKAKPSMAVGADLLKFSFKMHDAVPTNKTVSARINFNANSNSNDMSELKKIAENIASSTTKLLEELKK